MSEKMNEALIKAVRGGKVAIVRRLLEKGADPRADGSLALWYAAMNGYLEIVKLLLPVSDPKAENSSALQWAGKGGYLEIVRLLLPVSDPKTDTSLALRLAAESGHLEITKLLLPYSDYVVALGHPGFICSSGCDLLLSCLPEPFVKQFTADNPSLCLPRARAMLASQSLSSRSTPTRAATKNRIRS